MLRLVDVDRGSLGQNLTTLYLIDTQQHYHIFPEMSMLLVIIFLIISICLTL